MADERVVTELVIDADTSGADRYSQAMDRASGSSRAFSESQGSTGLAIAGVTASMLAAYAAISSGLDYVARLNKGLADLATQARNTGLSLADIQGLKFGGAIAGLSDAQMNSGLERSAQLLNDASRNSNSLSKELAANGLSVREANGQLISQNKLLGIAADLVSRARNPGDQNVIAQMLGFTKEWVPLLEQGSGAMAGLTAEAKKAGVVLDDEVVQRATEFDKQWRKSSVEMEYYLKSALLSLLPYADDLIDRLSSFVKSIDIAKAAAAAESHAQAVLAPGEEALKDAGVGGIRVGITPETKQALSDFISAPVFSDEFWRSAGRAFSSAVSIVRPEDMKWVSGTLPVRDTSDATMQAAKNAAAWSGAAKSWNEYSSAVVAGSARISSGFSNVATRTDESASAYDRAVESITKHTARTEADLAAIGLGAGAQEELRVSTQLKTAAELAGIPVTQKMRDQIQDLAQDAGEAAAALKLAKAQAEANFVSQTMLLGSADKTAASLMYNLYGDKWQSHMDDALAKQVRMNVLIGGAKDTAQQFATTFVQGILQGKSGMDALVASATQLSSKLADKGMEDLFNGDFIQGGLKLGASALISAFAGDEKQKKARDEWAKTGPAFELFIKQMTGGVQGEMSARIASASQQVQEMSDKAYQAKDWAGLARLQNAFNVFQGTQARQFISTFAATVEGMNDGFGADSPFLKAVEGVKNAVTYAKGFIDDAAKASEIFQGTWVGAGANEAAQKYVLSMLSGVGPMSEVATKMASIRGTATALQGALTDLGMSGDQAAAAIRGGVAKALDEMRASLSAGLTSRLNTANGAGYLNDTAALLEKHRQDVVDAAALGADAALVSAVFRAEAQKIVDDARLIGDSFVGFITQFPELAGVVDQSTTALADAAAAQAKAAQEAADAIQKSAQELATFVQGIAKTITQYLQSLKTGASSILSPQAQLAAAQSNFSAQLALAQGGNRDALGGITQVAQTLLDQAKSYYASSSGYTDIYNQVTNALQGLTGINPGTVANADTQALIAAAQATTVAVNATTGAVNNTGASNDNLTAAQNALINAQTSIITSSNSLASSQVALLGSVNSLADRFVAAINGLGALTAGIGTNQTGQFSYMIGLLEVIASRPPASGGGSVWDWLGFQNGGVIPGYAAGGVVGNGLPGIDSVVARYAGGGTIALAGQEGILTRDATSAIGGAATVDYINRNLRLPQVAPITTFRAPNDNARTSPTNFDWQGLARAIKQISDMSDERSADKSDELTAAIDQLPSKLASEIRRLLAGTKQRAA